MGLSLFSDNVGIPWVSLHEAAKRYASYHGCCQVILVSLETTFQARSLQMSKSASSAKNKDTLADNPNFVTSRRHSLASLTNGFATHTLLGG